MVQGHRENGVEIMAEPVIITAIRRSGVENAYIGTIGDDEYVYFNDAMFYRFKPTGTWEQNVYVLNRSRYSWAKCTMFEKISAVNLNAGAGSVAPGGIGVEGAIKWAIAVAEDASHGYDWDYRWGPDYDCSSLVYEAFRVGGGFDLPVHTGNTHSMIRDFTAIGFKWLAGKGNSASECVRGDILLNTANHTEIYIGNEMNVGAHINEKGTVRGGRSGDQTGREICTNAYYSYPWNGILRYEG